MSAQLVVNLGALLCQVKLQNSIKVQSGTVFVTFQFLTNNLFSSFKKSKELAKNAQNY